MRTYNLTLSSDFLTDALNGDLLSIRMFAADAVTGATLAERTCGG